MKQSSHANLEWHNLHNPLLLHNLVRPGQQVRILWSTANRPGIPQAGRLPVIHSIETTLRISESWSSNRIQWNTYAGTFLAVYLCWVFTTPPLASWTSLRRIFALSSSSTCSAFLTSANNSKILPRHLCGLVHTKEYLIPFPSWS